MAGTKFYTNWAGVDTPPSGQRVILGLAFCDELIQFELTYY